LVQGTHLVLRRPFVETAFLVQVPGDERIVFLIPWYGRTLLGTTETTIHGDPGRAEVRDEERRYLLRAVSAVLNEPPQEDDVVGAYVGVRALKERPGRSATALSRDFAVEEPARGLWLAVGGKLTTARADAARMVDRLVPAPDGESPTLSQVLPGGDIPHLGELERELWDRGRRLQLDEDVVDALLFRHGSEARLRLDEIDAQPALAKRLHPELPFARVELEHALAHEDCHTVDDALRRRLPLSILGGVSDGLREEVRQRLEGP
ncbi:MAG: FAD-dependent oxidoreductase, partial [Planctomycetes bacterium]|nr:FAD-dependent oxidoreductase [Planctomycetota bacterium]